MTERPESVRFDPRDLPEPPPEAVAHGERVAAHIREAINEAGGCIPFSHYMDLALYAPGLGYYSAGARKFGEAGDFITAPDRSRLFSICVADQCGEILGQLGGGDILELGAGSGAMAAGILQRLDETGLLPERYRILEVSADLRDRQHQAIEEVVPDLLERVEWIDDFPSSMRGMILGNEVLDALPVERFRIEEERVVRLGVAVENGGFVWQDMDDDEDLSRRVRAIEARLGNRLPVGFESEVSPGVTAMVERVSECLDAGAALFIDYGLPRREYYMPERGRGTLMCHYRHRAHEDPFVYPGLQDITAWVDFSAVAEAAVDADMRLFGFTTQAHFLLGAGIDHHLSHVDPGNTLVQLREAQEIKLLTLPGEMGERFKAMAFGKGDDLSLSGFEFRDLRFQL